MPRYSKPRRLDCFVTADWDGSWRSWALAADTVDFAMSTSHFVFPHTSDSIRVSRTDEVVSRRRAEVGSLTGGSGTR